MPSLFIITLNVSFLSFALCIMQETYIFSYVRHMEKI